eukprot:scaffold4409_cov369-Prasinococcus_capsulatus_cf.AAC.27
MLPAARRPLECVGRGTVAPRCAHGTVRPTARSCWRGEKGGSAFHLATGPRQRSRKGHAAVNGTVMAASISEVTELVQERRTGWSSPTWRWGFAVGDAHDAAYIARSSLQSRDSRRSWLVQLAQTEPSTTPWEEVKLVLALAFQKVKLRRSAHARTCAFRRSTDCDASDNVESCAASLMFLPVQAGHERRDGGAGGWLEVMERMVLAEYEGDDGIGYLAEDLRTRLPLLLRSPGPFQVSYGLPACEGTRVRRVACERYQAPDSLSQVSGVVLAGHGRSARRCRSRIELSGGWFAYRVH